MVQNNLVRLRCSGILTTATHPKAERCDFWLWSLKQEFKILGKCKEASQIARKYILANKIIFFKTPSWWLGPEILNLHCSPFALIHFAERWK